MTATPEERLAALTLSGTLERATQGVDAALLEIRPEIRSWSPQLRDACLNDAREHVRFLSQALAVGRPEMFRHYVGWADDLLAAVGQDRRCTLDGMAALRAYLMSGLPKAVAACAADYVDSAIAALGTRPSRTPATCMDDSAPQAVVAGRYLEAVLKDDRTGAQRIVDEAIDDGVDVHDVYLRIFQPALRETGRLWQLRRISVADEHYVSAVTRTIMGRLYTRFLGTRPNGKVMVSACVGGEQHDLGSQMVSDFFEADGWRTCHLGANVPNQAIMDAIDKYDPDVIGLSATIGYHVQRVEEITKAIRGHESGGRVKILVGGAAFNSMPGLWEDVGADAFAGDATDAVAAGRQLVEI